MTFSDFNLNPLILKGIDEAGFKECTQVQANSYPYTLAGKDVLVQSHTGSGKTTSFLVPIFHALLNQKENENKKALIVAPTRELAIQIHQECNRLGKHLPFCYGCFYGGSNPRTQETALKSNPSIVIGTPGRLLDFNTSKKLSFKDFSIIVIDEADRLFDMGFYPDIKFILKQSQQREDRQVMLFSATLSSRVTQLAWQFMNDPQEIIINSGSITLNEIQQSLYHVSSSEKFSLLLGLLKKYNPTSLLIFTNTKNQANIVSQKLNHNGYNSLFLSGDLPQKQRLLAINKFKEGQLPILIATDVAARGLHIDNLPLVINYDVPEDCEVYVHRIGRTARAGNKGVAITLACEKFVYHLEAIEKYIGQKIPVEYFDEALLFEDKSIGKNIVPLSSPNGKKSTHSKKEYFTKQKRPISQKEKKPKQVQASPTVKKITKPKSGSSQEERLAYYKEKYGDNFSLPTTDKKPVKKVSLFKRLFLKLQKGNKNAKKS